MSCKDCEKRKVGCHSTCEDYMKEKRQREELKRKIYKERDKERDILYQEVNRNERLKKGVKHGR